MSSYYTIVSIGGKFKGNPLTAARKAANRRVIPKKLFGVPYIFQMQKIGSEEINAYSATRIKLVKPIKFTIAGSERIVESKIEIKKL